MTSSTCVISVLRNNRKFNHIINFHKRNHAQLRLRQCFFADGRFIWVDGSAVEYEPWVPGSPNLGGTCVAARMLVGEQHTDGPWEDAFCSDRNPYVCKVPKGGLINWSNFSNVFFKLILRIDLYNTSCHEKPHNSRASWWQAKCSWHSRCMLNPQFYVPG